MLAITASSTCAVQMFDVAFSRRMCCSRVCSVSRYAGLPCESTETPTSRPGIERLNASLQARKAACGPPKPNGTPKRCELPTTMSAPQVARAPRAASAPAGRTRHRTARRPHAPARRTARMSWISPVVDGYCSKHAEVVVGFHQVRRAADLDLDAERLGARAHDLDRLRMAISGDEEDFALAPRAAPGERHRFGGGGALRRAAKRSRSPCRSGRPTIVWKLISASIRPCEISAWYGV